MSPCKLLLDSFNAAAAMALAVEIIGRIAVQNGIVVTCYGHGLPTRRNTVIEAGLPLPDAQGEQVAREIIAQVNKLGADDLLLCLLSGGGSSLLSLPVAGVALNDHKAVTQELLRSGATIQEINTVRKHLSAIQGSRLSTSCRARVLALVISDVTRDAPTYVASGPCASDPTTYRQALEIRERYQISTPAVVIDMLLAGKQGKLTETPKVETTGGVDFRRGDDGYGKR